MTLSVLKPAPETPLFIMGPCTLESWGQIEKIASLAQEFQITHLRTPLFKPRTSPESFQGLGHEGLELIEKLRTHFKAPLTCVSEVCSAQHWEVAQNHIDIFQVGARNMQNFELLKFLGRQWRPGKKILLKRGFSHTIDEWLYAADYLIKEGAPEEDIILCERGTRNQAAPRGVTLDLAMALEAKRRRGFKVICDPSHASKDEYYVPALAKASLAAGLDGLMIECHPRPQESVSDKDQALSLEKMAELLSSLPAFS